MGDVPCSRRRSFDEVDHDDAALIKRRVVAGSRPRLAGVVHAELRIVQRPALLGLLGSGGDVGGGTAGGAGGDGEEDDKKREAERRRDHGGDSWERGMERRHAFKPRKRLYSISSAILGMALVSIGKTRALPKIHCRRSLILTMYYSKKMTFGQAIDGVFLDSPLSSPCHPEQSHTE